MKRLVLAGDLARFLGTFFVLFALGALVQVAVAVIEQRFAAHRVDQVNANAITVAGNTLRANIDTTKGDAKLLAAIPAVRQFLSAPTPASREVTERLFATLAATRGDYAQVRLIDNRGMEVLRINRTANGVRVVPVPELQDKSSRPYVTATAKLGSGVFYVSPLDLNIEHGAVEKPYESTLRVGMPVFADDGTRVGMIVINLDGNQLLARFADDARLAQGSMWLVDRDGNWLIGPDPSREWRFMMPDAAQASVGSDLPAIWTVMQSAPRGQRHGSFGNVAFDTIDLNRGAGAGAPQLRIITLTKTPSVTDILLSRSYVLFLLLSIAPLLILAGLLTRLRIGYRVIHDEMQANARLMEDIFRHSSMAMKVKDANGRIVRINETAAKLMGRPASELIGKSIDKVASAESAALVHEHDHEVIAGRSVTAYEEQLEYLGGSYTLLTRRFPVTDASGEVAGIGVISMDITQRIHMEQVLRMAKLEAEAANRAKSLFLANMSHELRTPLNSIIGLSELTLEQAYDREDNETAEVMQRVVNAGRHLLSLINDVLDISRIESGRIELHAEVARVDTLVESVINSMQPLASANTNKLLLEVAPDVGLACVDVMRLRQVMLNLIGNAIKFTRNGEVKVALSSLDDHLQITVSDTGIGMTPEQLQRVFEPFEQADRSIARRFGGSGLGLSISRQLVALMGGRIEATSDIHCGSVFTVSLPVGDIDGFEPPAPQPGADANFARRRRPVVLVVDDDADACELVRNALKRNGINVVSAASGREALALTRSLRPAVMVLDIMLGDMSGWDVLAALRADPDHAELPVILCTVTDPEQRTGVLGVIEHLVKPFDRDHLSRLVQRFVGSAKRGRLLVVDDDDFYRDKVAGTLREEGYHVETAANGQRALGLMREHVPDLVLLDLVMPGLDGLAVIEAMRAEEMLALVPIMLVTAADVTPEMNRSLYERAVLLVRKGDGSLVDVVRHVHHLLDQLHLPAIEETT
ncbi:MAG TPA: response regulator [Dyella sp.]|uniref:response regulator n=1 Tax=Dyella sp. TaxID=1869338 RepID=UPI002CBC6566|nr:response regulator [Dyella sp.]HTV84673.1 response regulator [Dyella sp.]